MSDETGDKSVKNRCPYCDEVVEADVELVGQLVTCSNQKCGREFKLSVPSGRPTQQGGSRTGIPTDQADQGASGQAVSEESQLFIVHPAFIRMRLMKSLGMALIGLAGMVVLIAGFGAGLGLSALEWLSSLPSWLLMGLGGLLLAASLLTFFWWWLVAQFTTVIVTNKRTTYRVGIISRDSSEVQHDDVRNLQMDQNILERILGIGDIAISSSGQDDMEIEIDGIPDPERIAKVIRKYQ